jgi:hypothetical protein
VFTATATGLVTAGGFVPGRAYTIVSRGTTNFITIGSSSNTVGTSFIATAAGTGTGTEGANDGALGLTMFSRGSSTGFYVYRVNSGGFYTNTSAATPSTSTLVFINTGSTGRFSAGGVGVDMQSFVGTLKSNIDTYLAGL